MVEDSGEGAREDYAVAAGHMLRYLDMGNRSEAEMVDGLVRITLELRIAG